MANFASLDAAEARAKAKMADGTWVVAHAGYASYTTSPCVRFMRYMIPLTSGNQRGSWNETLDDAAV